MSRLVIVLVGLALTVSAASGEPVIARDPSAGMTVVPPDDRGGATTATVSVPPPSQSGVDAAPLKLGEASEGWATARLVAVLVVMFLGVPVVLWARRRRGGLAKLVARTGWLGQLVAEPVASADRIEVVSRRALSQREWLAVVRVGDERFLLAATAMRVSLLSRLADAPAEPAAFDVELLTRTAQAVDQPPAPAPVIDASEDALRSAVARARTRLSALASVDAGMTGRRA
jgi:flagellar biogenesis protein FliO